MSRDFPDTIDPWQMAQRRQCLTGRWPLARFERLASMLADTAGEVAFTLTFGVDDMGLSCVDVELKGELTLTCQRSLELYQHPVDRTVRLGLLRDEADEAALAPGYEPLVVPGQAVQTLALVEDELILAVPLVPKKPDAPLDLGFGPAPETKRENPFAVLKELKN